jgi:acetyl-CoA carboxylase, biotin carboxylase subunit
MRAALESPRQIEFQILGAEHENVIHLGERQCSIQRRLQKLLEESPSTLLTPAKRRQMGQLVVEAPLRRAAAFLAHSMRLTGC